MRYKEHCYSPQSFGGSMDFGPHTVSRFWRNVHKESGHCWIWQSYVGKNGYGMFRLGEATYRAHRVAYQLTKGELKPGFVIAHLCDVKLCCNPEHLTQVTQQENLRMVHNLGHTNSEFTNAKMKLSTEAIIDILQGGESDRHYARKYGVDHKSIPRIRKSFTFAP